VAVTCARRDRAAGFSSASRWRGLQPAGARLQAKPDDSPLKRLVSLEL